MADKYHDTVAKSTVLTDDEKVKAEVAKILNDELEANRSIDVYKLLFNCIDLTTLKSTDSPQSVAAFTERVNAFEEEHGDLPNVAAICVYPNFAQVVRTVLE
ncbi:MAG: deoxyribose-phosphate aldolase, partial [Paramuribaculum sp.]|nr:deoxyribose-phosphate aldolase [Paramuribaculum sp.]